MLLDSVIVIDHLNGKRAAIEFIAENEQEIRLSVITRAEVLVGVSEHGLVAVRRLPERSPRIWPMLWRHRRVRADDVWPYQYHPPMEGVVCSSICGAPGRM